MKAFLQYSEIDLSTFLYKYFILMAWLNVSFDNLGCTEKDLLFIHTHSEA